MAGSRTVVMDLRVDQSVQIGGATVTLREKSGRRAKLVIVAGPGVVVGPPVELKPQEIAKAGTQTRANLAGE